MQHFGSSFNLRLEKEGNAIIFIVQCISKCSYVSDTWKIWPIKMNLTGLIVSCDEMLAVKDSLLFLNQETRDASHLCHGLC